MTMFYMLVRFPYKVLAFDEHREEPSRAQDTPISCLTVYVLQSQ